MRKMAFLLLPLFVLPACKKRVVESATLESGVGTLPPWKDRSYARYGAVADCGEKPMDYAAFLELARSIPNNEIDPQQAVLDKIQKLGVLQTFTINFKSESAQSEGISKEYPGVIRMRQDGTLIVRYTCDRSKPTYGNFELIAFDKKARRFRFASVDMRTQPKERVSENPSLCYGCHDYGGKDDLRPNWNMYPDWKGMFGSHDDFFPKGTEAETVDVGHAEGWLPPDRTEELKDYETFLATSVHPDSGNPDPCYATLPWLKESEAGAPIPEVYKRWPYGMTNGSAKKRIYATRPNLKFTEVLSKLLALRTYRRLTETEGFAEVEPYLAVEAAYCAESSYEFQGSAVPRISKADLDEMITQALPNYKRPKSAEAKAVDLRGTPMPHHDPRHETSRAQALYGVSTALGIEGGEWTLDIFEYGDPQFETGAGPGANVAFPADLPLSAYIQQEILANAAAQDPTLTPLFTRGRGESQDFGKHFACIDDLAGPTVFENETNWQKLCDKLIDRAKTIASLSRGSRGIARSRGGLEPPPTPLVPRFNPERESLKAYLKRVNTMLKERGEFHYENQ